ncbi:MAG: peroxiredoxin [Phycisphaerae bacterium]|nr:peroxiredoxin [Phycisphaerae bacterium]
MGKARRIQLIGAVAVLAIGVAVYQGVAQTTQPVGGDGVFIHLSKGLDNSRAVLMALQMAEIMSADRPVLVYADLEGVRVLLRDAPNFQVQPYGRLREKLQTLRRNGAILMVCPTCLRAAGRRESDLGEGVRLADKDVFFSFTSGRILTLDY